MNISRLWCRRRVVWLSLRSSLERIEIARCQQHFKTCQHHDTRRTARHFQMHGEKMWKVKETTLTSSPRLLGRAKGKGWYQTFVFALATLSRGFRASAIFVLKAAATGVLLKAGWGLAGLLSVIPKRRCDFLTLRKEAPESSVSYSVFLCWTCIESISLVDESIGWLCQLSSSSDGLLHFGMKAMLVNHQSKGALPSPQHLQAGLCNIW